MIQIFSLVLAANESREAAVSGEYFELRNAPEPIALIELLDRSGSVISRLENPEQSDYVKPGRYETVRITNGPTAQTVRHFYGSGDAGSRRTSGLVTIDGTSNVSVVDGGKLRALAENSYAGGAYSNSVVGEYSEVQLWNPPASGKNIFLTQINFSSAVDSAIFLFATMAVQANLRPYTNKKLGGPAGIAELRWGSTPAFSSAYFGYSHVAAYEQNTLKFSDPFIVPPGYGLTVNGSLLDTLMGASFEWFEEPI